MKWVKRHPKLMMATTAMLFVFLTGTAASLIAVNRERSETAAQRDAAQENLQLAISALDEVYHEIGSHWIDSDRNLTDTQARFLRRSAQLLTEIANRFPASSTSYASAGLAHLHAANANARTHAFKEAATGYDRSSRLLAKAIDVEPHISSLRESLATAEFQRARLFRKRWRLDDAAEAYRASRAQAQHLLTAEPGDDRHLVHAFSVDAELLSLAALKLDDEHVVEQGLRMKLQLEQLSEADPDRVHLQLVRLELMRRLSSSMRRLNRADEALAICRDLAKDSAFPLQDSQDHRQVARSLAGIIAEIGRCQLELGDYTKAEQHLRDGMARLRQSFLFDGTPKEFSMAYMRHEASHDLMEPDAFAQYAGVQASLASVLDKTNQRQLALAQAEEAVRSCLTLNYLFPMIPAYALDTVECALVLTELRGRAASDEQIMSIEKLILNVDRQLRTYARFRQPPRRFIESLHAFRTTNNLDTERVTEDAPEGT